MGVIPDNNIEVPDNLFSNGIVFENGCTNSNINGGSDRFGSIPVANIFPVRSGVNRSSTTLNTSPDYDPAWKSHLVWRSIINQNPSSLVKITTYKNCFVGNCLPNNNSQFRIFYSPGKCYTLANINPLPTGSDFTDYTLVCENSYNGSQVVFPYIGIGRKGFTNDSTKTAPVLVAPNPASDKLIVDGLQDLDYLEASIVDGTGKVVLSYSIAKLNIAVFPIESIANGIYSLLLSGNSKSQTIKFVKQ